MVDVDVVLDAWKARGFKGGMWMDPPGRQWMDYVHDVDELFMVMGGDVELEIEGQTLRPAPGEEVMIPAGAVHSVRNVGSVNSCWLYSYYAGKAE